MKPARFTMAARRVNMRYSVKETVELVLDGGSDLEDFSDSGSEENNVDSGEEFVPVDLKADSSDSDNNIFIFIIGIRATHRIKLCFYCVWTVPTLLLGQRKVYDMTLWIINLTSTHSKLSKNVYVYCIIHSSLFTTILFKRAKTVCLQEPSAPFCGILNELTGQSLYSVLLGLDRPVTV